MAARTDSVVKRIDEAENAVSWRLESGRAAELLPLQKWRVIGDERSFRDQIVAYESLLQTADSMEGENNVLAGPSEQPVPKESVPSSYVTGAMGEDDQESHGNSRPAPSVDLAESPSRMLIDNEEAEIGSRTVSSSSGSEMKYADGYVSGQEEAESKEEELEDDHAELSVNEAHHFQIFKSDDEAERQPACILGLAFDLAKGQVGASSLIMIGCSSKDQTGFFMRTIDSWSMQPENNEKFRLSVRNEKGAWIKLFNPRGNFQVSVRGALILANFLELAIDRSQSKPKKFLDELVHKTRSSRPDIKSVLRTHFESVVKKFVVLEKAPSSLRDSPIIYSMERVLMGTGQRAANASTSPNERPSSSDMQRGPTTSETLKRPINVASELPVPVIKRRRIVESESGSDSEDYIPLAQRTFQSSNRSSFEKLDSRGEPGEDTANADDTAKASGSKDTDDLPLLPVLDSNAGPSTCDGPSRWNTDGGEQEFLDIAEIYGGHSDVPGDIGDEDDDDEELGTSAFCAICDDGGDLLFCDGPCMRSFHASKEAAAKSDCSSLNFTVEEIAEMGSWLCPNCVHGQHQCFICRNLGISDGDNKEVFVCDVALCGRFYHPGCLADWKATERFCGITDRDAFIRGVEEGTEEFCCPAHKCRKCGECEEDGSLDNKMKLAKCRRCPMAYHKGCLPKAISFDSEDDRPIRAWEIGKNLLIYCLQHQILGRLNTPRRDHITWPSISSLKVINVSSLRPRDSGDDVAKLKRLPLHSPKVPLKGPSLKKTVHKNKSVAVVKHVREKPGRSHAVEIFKSLKEERQLHLKRTAPAFESFPAALRVRPVDLLERKEHREPITQRVAKDPICTEGQRTRLQALLQRSTLQITLDAVKDMLEQPSCYGENKKKSSLHRGEILSILNAAKKALEKIKNGGSVEDAKRLCPKDLFWQMLKAEENLRVYLAPFLHGMRYTSFGRHFTCVDKLKEIVERIYPYIDSGDMVVDFCCGANDFSILLNEKLLSVGKTCSFRNFDIHPPKNGFCFTKGDWLKNEGHGFFEGKKLVMGLNPPFGVKAALATKFIEHALRFKPKLLVLIVPPETMSHSHDYKRHNYELVWEDKDLLQGHAFYLPGSVGNDEKENATQWNNVTPPLFLWSEGNMAWKHKDIAIRCGHVGSGQVEQPVIQGESSPGHVPTQNPHKRKGSGNTAHQPAHVPSSHRQRHRAISESVLDTRGQQGHALKKHGSERVLLDPSQQREKRGVQPASVSKSTLESHMQPPLRFKNSAGGQFQQQVFHSFPVPHAHSAHLAHLAHTAQISHVSHPHHPSQLNPAHTGMRGMPQPPPQPWQLHVSHLIPGVPHFDLSRAQVDSRHYGAGPHPPLYPRSSGNQDSVTKGTGGWLD